MPNFKADKIPQPNMKADELALVRSILSTSLPKSSEIWIFGSRATQHIKPFSDLDLFIKSLHPISLSLLTQCAFLLEESGLPYSVDLLDWSKISAHFQETILNSPHFLLFVC